MQILGTAWLIEKGGNHVFATSQVTKDTFEFRLVDGELRGVNRRAHQWRRAVPESVQRAAKEWLVMMKKGH